MWSPLSWAVEAGALVPIVLLSSQGQPSGWEYFCGIVSSFLIISAIRFYKERNAGNARNLGIDSAMLVPSNMISFKNEDIAPAASRSMGPSDAPTGTTTPSVTATIYYAEPALCQQRDIIVHPNITVAAIRRDIYESFKDHLDETCHGSDLDTTNLLLPDTNSVSFATGKLTFFNI